MEMAGIQPNSGGQEQFMATQQSIGLPWRLSAFAIALFALALFTWAGLRYGYQSYLEEQVKATDTELAGLAEKISADQQDHFITLYSQITNLKGVLDKHQFTANALPVLEKNVASGVIFTSAKMDADTLSLELTGITPVFETLAAQMLVLEKAPEVASVALEKVNLASGNVNFSLALTFKPEAFVKQTF
jgi:hypothetical protein